MITTLPTVVYLSVLLIVQVPVSQSTGRPASDSDWKLVRSVQNPYGGSQDLVLIPESKKRDEDYYLRVADAVCGQRVRCMVHFWTDSTHIPTSANMRVEDLAVMTAAYERHPDYETPVLNLACWLYPNKEVAERAKCTYEPGAKVPWKK